MRTSLRMYSRDRRRSFHALCATCWAVIFLTKRRFVLPSLRLSSSVPVTLFGCANSWSVVQPTTLAVPPWVRSMSVNLLKS